MAKLTQTIADTVTSLGVETAYGDPIELEGTTIVPVAVVSYGFGVGEGNIEPEGSGAGGGGGGLSIPTGAYITRDGDTRFEPNIITLLTVGVSLIWAVGRALSLIIRALKK